MLIALVAGLVAPAGAADTKPLAVSAVVLSKNICKLETNTAANLDFGALNTASGADVARSTSFTARCLGSAKSATFAIAQNGGLNRSGGRNRMRHASGSADYIPYSLAISPSKGTVPKNQIFTITVTGTALGSDYQDAHAGGYSDTVVLNINP
jgi:spore coat protein U-like protein